MERKLVLLLLIFMTSQLVLGKINRMRPAARRRPRDFTKMCPCALNALRQMDRILRKHHASSVTKPISDVMKQIEKVAYDCTKQSDCKCPDGYQKTPDGFSCYLISEEKVPCADANTICQMEFEGQLAVAKSEKALMSLAQFISDNDKNDGDFYWIGLSYNTTIGNSPVWKWSDGSKAKYEVTKELDSKPASVKKSLLNFIGGDVPIERVAISKDMEGARWRQEECGVKRGGEVSMHHYVCEYTMFKVEILSEEW